MQTAFISFLVLVVVGIVLAVLKKKNKPTPPVSDPMKFRPAPSFGAPAAGQTGDAAIDQSAIDTARAAAGFNQPQE